MQRLAMDIESVRRYCLSLPQARESLQWGDNLVFKIGGRMFAVLSLSPSRTWLSFKCSVEDYCELVERPDIIPAPYLARARWVALQTADALTAAELTLQLRRAYDLVREKLPQQGKRQKRRR